MAECCLKAGPQALSGVLVIVFPFITGFFLFLSCFFFSFISSKIRAYPCILSYIFKGTRFATPSVAVKECRV